MKQLLFMRELSSNPESAFELKGYNSDAILFVPLDDNHNRYTPAIEVARSRSMHILYFSGLKRMQIYCWKEMKVKK